MSLQAEMDIGTIAAVGPVGGPPSSKYERLIAKAKEVPAASTLVVYPCEEAALRGPTEAAAAGIITPIRTGGENQGRGARTWSRYLALRDCRRGP